MTISELEYEQANARMRRLQKGGAVVFAKHQRSTRRVVVELVSGVQLSIPLIGSKDLPKPAHASWRTSRSAPAAWAWAGLGWTSTSTPSLLQGVPGSKKWMASLLGKSGGASRSDAKRAAARENGRLGGRPSNASEITTLRKRASAK